MEQKDMYSIEELYENLEISMLELSRRSNVNPGTLARIRKGNFARRPTVNKLLRTLSELYGIRLSVKNVSGIYLESDKPQVGVPEKAIEPSVPTSVKPAKPVAEKAPKRAYNKRHDTGSSKDTGLPDGCILASKFAEAHGVARPTFIDHMNNGLGPGLIGTSTDTIPERDHVDYSKREKRTRKDGTIEYERYLDQEQQHAALEFWKRHDVCFSECNDIGCWCHTVLKENN